MYEKHSSFWFYVYASTNLLWHCFFTANHLKILARILCMNEFHRSDCAKSHRITSSNTQGMHCQLVGLCYDSSHLKDTVKTTFSFNFNSDGTQEVLGEDRNNVGVLRKNMLKCCAFSEGDCMRWKCSLLTIVKQMLVFRKGALWIWAWSMFLWQNNVQDAKRIPRLLYLLNIMHFFNHTTHDQIQYDLCCQNLPAGKY